MEYYLGVDIGTTSTKAVAFGSLGQELTICSVIYNMQHPLPNQSEQYPDEIFNAVVSCINKVVKKMRNREPVLISFSAAMHSLLAVDENGNPLTKLIIWADNRAAAIAENIKNSVDGKDFYRKTGVPVHAMSPFCKLLWMKENEPMVFAKAYKFIGIKEYVFYKLFGEYMVDRGIASATGLLNIKTLEWDESILDYVGITVEKLARVVSVKRLFYIKNEKQKHAGVTLKISSKTPFIIGGSDGAMANISETISAPNAMVITIGTSLAARVTTDNIKLDREMRTFCYHSKDDEYIVGGAGNNGGVVLQWLKEKILNDTGKFEDFLALAQDVAPGSDGLVFLPYLLGERAPLWNENAKGVFFGLTAGHTKAHIIRAAIEGVMYALYNISKTVTDKYEIAQIVAGGGFAQNAMWFQMLADMYGHEVCLPVKEQSSAFGAVVTGMEALHIKSTFLDPLYIAFPPQDDNHKIYMELFEKFERLYDLLKEEF